MVRYLAVFFLISLASVVTANDPGLVKAPFVPGEVLVSWHSGMILNEVELIVEARGGRIIDVSRTGGNFARVEVPEDLTVGEFINELQAEKSFMTVEPNYYRYASFTPNDPYYSYQWNFQKINLSTAWNTTTGAGVTVAVVDTGVSTAGSDRFAHFIGGYDFVSGDTNPTDLNGHGTHVAGTIAQATNNGVGVAGIAYNASLMAVRVLDANGSGSVYWVADGIRYAANNGANVINLSLGSSTGSTIEEDAINYAAAAGVIICAAAGNSGASTGVEYPARYAACIAVGATRYDNTRVSYSTRGTGLDLMAPGGDLTVDQNGDGYADGVLQETFSSGTWGYYFFEGTSMATPHVVGVAALVWSANPSYTRDQVRSALESTATDLGTAGYDTTYGFGLVNAAAAVSGQTPPTATPAPTPTPVSCTVTITKATWSASKKTLTLEATCSQTSTLSVYTDGVYQGTMTYSSAKRKYTFSKRLTVKPTQVTVTAACGGSYTIGL